MATLYEINDAILACIDMETGEVLDNEALDNLIMERETKLENVALWVKNLESDAAAYEAEKKVFEARAKAAKNRAESLKRYLTYALEGQKFKTAKCAVSFRKSYKVDVLDVEQIPVEYVQTVTEKKPDKTALKDVLKTGAEVPGCRLVESLNIGIK